MSADVPDAYNVPAASDVPDVPDAALAGEYKSCAARDRHVSADTFAQLSTNGITPLTDREHDCANCASKGLCKKHCISESSRSNNVATTKQKPLWGTREATDA